VTVLLRQADRGTLVTLRMENFESTEERDANKPAWEQGLAILGGVVGTDEHLGNISRIRGPDAFENSDPDACAAAIGSNSARKQVQLNIDELSSALSVTWQADRRRCIRAMGGI
jgi:hypothetical protein